MGRAGEHEVSFEGQEAGGGVGVASGASVRARCGAALAIGLLSGITCRP